MLDNPMIRNRHRHGTGHTITKDLGTRFIFDTSILIPTTN